MTKNKALTQFRGSGEMMTKSPIMLTLGEGTDHIAYFNNDPNKVYDLTKEVSVIKSTQIYKF